MNGFLNDTIGGEDVLRAASVVIFLSSLVVATAHASGIYQNVASREARLFFWCALLLVAFRVMVRSQFNLVLYQWWGNVCWWLLALASLRMAYEYITGDHGWPIPDKAREKVKHDDTIHTS